MAGETTRPAGPSGPKPSGPPRLAAPAAPAKPPIVWPELRFKGEAASTVMPPEMRHLVVLASFYGWGKTTFALGADVPANILMLDYEGKGEMIAEQLGVDNYFPVAQECSQALGTDYSQVHLYRRTKAILEAVPPGRFTTLVLDGLTILQGGIVEQVELNPEGYGLKSKNVETGSFGGPYPGVNYIIRQLIDKAREKQIKLIVVTTEIKAKWGKEGPILNKFEKKGTSVIDQMSVLTLILMQPGYPEFGGAPMALVLKEQLAKYEWVNGKQVVKKRIPPKLPCATFSEVYHYLQEPCNYSNLTERERPTKDEMEPFKPIISSDQLSAMLRLLELQTKMGAIEEAEGRD
jgi:hypothetical protein